MDSTLFPVLLAACVGVPHLPPPSTPAKVFNRLLDGFEGHLTNAKYAKIANCSPDTALRDIRQLLGWGLLIANAGGGRSTSCRLAHSRGVPSSHVYGSRRGGIYSTRGCDCHGVGVFLVYSQNTI